MEAGVVAMRSYFVVIALILLLVPVYANNVTILSPQNGQTFPYTTFPDANVSLNVSSVLTYGKFVNLFSTNFTTNQISVGTVNATNDTYFIIDVSSSNQFYFFNYSSNITVSLNDTDTNNWMGTTRLTAVASTKNGDAYIGGSNGLFGFYNSSTNITEMINGTSGNTFFGRVRTEYIVATNDGAYFCGTFASFGFYNRSTGTTIGLNGTLNQTFNIAGGGTTPGNTLFNGMSVFPNGDVYISGNGYGTEISPLYFYNKSSNVIEDKLNLTDALGTSNDLSGVSDILPDGSVYIGGSANNRFGLYNRTTNTSVRLSSIASTSNIYTLAVTKDGIYIGTSGVLFFAFFNITSNTTMNLSYLDDDNWIGNQEIFSFSETNNGDFFVGTGGGDFGFFDTHRTINTVDTWAYILKSGSSTIFTPNTTFLAQGGFNNLSVYMNDSFGVSSYAQVNFSVANPPNASAELRPTISYRNDTIFAYVTIFDDAYIENLSVHWKIFNETVKYANGTTNNLLNGTEYNIYNFSTFTTKHGENWTLEAIGDDGFLNGTAVNSTTLMISNSLPVVNSLTLNISNLGGTHESVFILNATDIDGVNELDHAFTGIVDSIFVNGIAILDVSDSLSLEGTITINDTLGGITLYSYNFSFTNNTYNEDTSFGHNMSLQRIIKSDTLYNFASTPLLYNILHLNYTNGTLVSGGTFSGSLITSNVTLVSKWNVDYLNASRISTIVNANYNITIGDLFTLYQTFNVTNYNFDVSFSSVTIDLTPFFDTSYLNNISYPIFTNYLNASSSNIFNVTFATQVSVQSIEIPVSECPVGANYFINYCSNFSTETVGSTIYNYYHVLTKINVTTQVNDSNIILPFDIAWYSDWSASGRTVIYMNINGSSTGVQDISNSTHVIPYITTAHTVNGSLLPGSYIIDVFYYTTTVLTGGGSPGGGGGGGGNVCGDGICGVNEETICPKDCGNVSWAFEPPFRRRQVSPGSCDTYDFVIKNTAASPLTLTLIFEDSGDGSSLWSTINGSARTTITMPAGTDLLPARKDVIVKTCVPKNAENKVYRFSLSSIGNQRKKVAPVEVDVTNVPAPIQIIENIGAFLTGAIIVPGNLPALGFLFTPLVWIFIAIPVLIIVNATRPGRRKK